eukprot:gene1824-2097_t
MGAPYFQIKDTLRRHGIVAFSSNYALYGQMSERVMTLIESMVCDSERYPLATVEHIHFSPHDLSVKDRLITYSSNSSRVVIEGLPQIFWVNGLPWREANLWAMERVTNGEAILKTVSSNVNGLLNYAKFLESRRLEWFEFPSRKADRCLVQYRGALIKARDAGHISPATASEYMRNCISFYRWVRKRGLLSPLLPLWKDKRFFIKYFDQV